MYKKWVSTFLIMMFTGFILIGCWDSGEIEQLNNLSLVIVDYKEEAYSFYVEVANVLGGSSAETGKEAYSILIATDESLIGTRDELNRRSDNPIYLGASRAVIFSQNMAENGIEEYVNRIRGEENYRKSVLLLTTSTDPLEFIKDKPENASSVGDSVDNTLEGMVDIGQTITMTVGDVLQILELEDVGFLLPKMDIETNEKTMSGYSVFKEAKCIGVIPAKKRKGVVYLLGKKPQFYYEIYDNQNHYIINVVLKKKSIKPTLNKDQVTFDIDMTFECQIQYMGKMIPISKEQQKQLSQKLTDMVEEDIKTAIKESQRTYRSDYLEFYKYFRVHYLSEFKQLDWETTYAQANIKIKVNADLEESPAFEFIKKE